MGTQKTDNALQTSRRRVLGAGVCGLGALLVPGMVGTRSAAAATAPQESTLDRIKRTGVFNLGVREADPGTLPTTSRLRTDVSWPSS